MMLIMASILDTAQLTLYAVLPIPTTCIGESEMRVKARQYHLQRFETVLLVSLIPINGLFDQF